MAPLSYVKSVTNYLLLPTDKIRKHIPPRNGIRESKCFELLSIAYYYPNMPVSGFQKLIRSFNSSSTRSIAYLVELGLLSKKNRPYWVPQIKAWRVDITYQITAKGVRILTVLDKDLSGVDNAT